MAPRPEAQLRQQDVGRGDIGRITGFTLDVATDPGDSATTFGIEDPFGNGTVRVGPGVAGLAPTTPTLLAPPTAGPVSVTTPRVPPATDVSLIGTAPAVRPTFGGMANFEPSSVEWLGLTNRPTFGGITVD